MRLLLDHGDYPAIATHDVALMDADHAVTRRERSSPRDRFEFQMLYGIRRDLQASHVADGYRVRVYVPFGREWFPVLHAPAWRTAGERRVRDSGDSGGEEIVLGPRSRGR